MNYTLEFLGMKFKNVSFAAFVVGMALIMPAYLLCLAAVLKLAWAIVFGGLV